MSRLDTILNPEDDYRSSLRPTRPPSPAKCPPSPSSSASAPLEPVNIARPHKATQPHEPHPSCPDTLSCLPDADGRPQHTLPVILRCAILGSPKKRLTIREIYAAMEDKYPYYKTAGPTWKVANFLCPSLIFLRSDFFISQQSVRHHLSLNRLFERQPRPVTDPGFGSYWTVNLDAPPGTKRPRKRGRPQSQANDSTDPPVPKKRGRPRKNPLPVPAENAKASGSNLDHPPIATLPKSGVDRVEKVARTHRLISSLRTGSMDRYDDDEEDEITADGLASRARAQHDEDDEYESEEDMNLEGAHLDMNNFNKSARYFYGMGAQPSIHRDLPETMIDRLKIEMAGLRRQSADAVSVSMRMSDQLAEAQADASRARAALKTAEEMLEDEARKRREAEKLADEEAKARRAAEDMLKAYMEQLQVMTPKENEVDGGNGDDEEGPVVGAMSMLAADVDDDDDDDYPRKL
ncbi:hypothetical protein EW146_g6730 [Bondarzewia mesenterica]|uniref:Fork-head domain-containing protein n=1 Tax=Bondarzewia mesenterica TaxID=1095465 RepID=A0A4S4LNN8_9AGAM|nr:hypothetical protein EW146_g6730 [Bondarzewia mesenterica]